MDEEQRKELEFKKLFIVCGNSVIDEEKKTYVECITNASRQFKSQDQFGNMCILHLCESCGKLPNVRAKHKRYIIVTGPIEDINEFNKPVEVKLVVKDKSWWISRYFKRN